MEYPVDIETRLAEALPDIKTEDARALVTAFFDRLPFDAADKAGLRVDLFRLLGVLARRAMDYGLDVFQRYYHGLIDPLLVTRRYETRAEFERWLVNFVLTLRAEMEASRDLHIGYVVAEADAIIARGYANPGLTLVQAAGELHLNPAYFSRLYKLQTGKNFVSALTEARVANACDLLRGTREKVCTVAALSGYKDVKYFCTVFKRATGRTPQDYRVNPPLA